MSLQRKFIVGLVCYTSFSSVCAAQDRYQRPHPQYPYTAQQNGVQHYPIVPQHNPYLHPLPNLPELPALNPINPHPGNVVNRQIRQQTVQQVPYTQSNPQYRPPQHPHLLPGNPSNRNYRQPPAEQNYQNQFNGNMARPSGSVRNNSYRAQSDLTGQTTLQQSLRNAYFNSPELAVEQIRIKEAEERLEQAKAQERFKLDLSAEVDATQSETVFNVVNRTDSEFQIGRAAALDLTLPLYQGGRLKSQKRSAETGVKAASLGLSATQIELSKQTALSYLDVYQNRELLRIYSNNVSLLQRQQKTAELLVQSGEYTVSDKALIDTRLSAVLVDYENAAADLRHSESSYKNLVGHSPPRLLPTPRLSIPQSLFEVKRAARDRNSEVLSTQIQAESAAHNLGVAKSAHRPKLSFHARLRGAEGQSNTISRDSAAEVRLRFKMPLLSGGENKSKEREAILAQSRASMEIRNAMSDIETRSEILWSSLKAAQRSNRLYVDQVRSANQAYSTISRQKDLGLATVLDVLSVEQTLLNAKLNQVRSATKEETAKVELLSLMGQSLYSQ